MFQPAAIALALIACALAFAAPSWAWTPLGLGALLLWMFSIGVRRRRYSSFPELSLHANEMLARFGHFYAMPVAGRSVSAAASTIVLAGLVVAIICAVRGYLLVGGIAALTYVVVAPLGRQFNPSQFLVDDRERAAHQEIINYLMTRATTDLSKDTRSQMTFLHRLFGQEVKSRPLLDIMRDLSATIVDSSIHHSMTCVAALRSVGHAIAAEDTQAVLNEFVFLELHLVDRTASAMLTRRTQDLFLPAFVKSTLWRHIKVQAPESSDAAADAHAISLLPEFDLANHEYAARTFSISPQATALNTNLPFRFAERVLEAARVAATSDDLVLCMSALKGINAELAVADRLSELVQLPDDVTS